MATAIPMPNDPNSAIRGRGRRLPVLLQSEYAECGLTCLAMIASYHGFETDSNHLRRRFAVSSNGSTLKSLMNTANELKLATRAVRIELSAVRRLTTPCILHWDMNHFVVLKSVARHNVTIHDPATGLRKINSNELSQHFTGVALELWPTADFSPAKDIQRLALSVFWKGLPGIGLSFAQLLFCSLLLQGFLLLSPLYMQIVVDDVVLREDQNLLLVVALGFALLLLIEMGVSVLRQFILIRVASRMNLNLASRLFHHLIRLPLDFFEKRHIGDIVSRFGSLDSVRHTLTTGLVSAIVDGVLAISTLVAMYWYNEKLATLALVTLTLYIGFRIVLYRPLRLLSEESLIANAHKDSNFLESARAIQTIKLFGGESDRQMRWQNRLIDCINIDIRIAKLQILFELGNRVLLSGGNILIIYFAAISVINGAMTLGMLFAFISFKRHFIAAMDTFIDHCIELKMIGLHLQRLSEITFSEQDIYHRTERPNNPSTSLFGKIEAKNLTFFYPGSQDAVFTNLSFTVNPGQTLAIKGGSGAGKSTLMKCLMGLTTPASGHILIDGKPIKNITNYRETIASVMQETEFLSGSISENIACFDDNPNIERLTMCASLSLVHSEICNLPMQYNTIIGHSRTPLSKGQQQRIAISRAIYKRPKILFLDEATSNLNIELADTITQNLKKSCSTMVVISHQASLIESADVTVELI